MADILLSTLNARYSHCALGLRYLKANLGSLMSRSEILEFVIHQSPAEIVENLLEREPDIIGFGIYIWNVQQTSSVIRILKQVSPHIKIVVGGPEVSYESETFEAWSQVDVLISGAAEQSFRQTCERILSGMPLAQKRIEGVWLHPRDLQLPYDHYTDDDIKNRVLYVEASRGCPFKCEFCLLLLDKSAWSFDLESFLGAIERLYRRGARRFKFVDRTFNLSTSSCEKILDYFLSKDINQIFLHFELIPDRLPIELAEKLRCFPSGRVQLEIGIQSMNPEVQHNIKRKQRMRDTLRNIRWLRENTGVHLHLDLIVGLPGETHESLARGFDQLYALSPQEIQLGILKRLKGTPIDRHTNNFDMRYDSSPPYSLLANRDISFFMMQRISRFSKYWDMIMNSGRFRHSGPYIVADAPFERFLKLSDWLFQQGAQAHGIALKRLFVLVHQGVYKVLPEIVSTDFQDALVRDYQCSGQKGPLPFIDSARSDETVASGGPPSHDLPARQARFLRNP